MAEILFIHKKNNNIKFQDFSKQILASGARSLCLSKIKKDFLIESIEKSDYLFVNIFRKQIRGFATVYHDNYEGKHLHISLICNAKTHRMTTRKNINTPKLAGKNIIDAIIKYGKQINVKDVRLDAIKEVIPYYYKIGFRFENSQNNAETQKTLVKELENAYTNNNKPAQKKALGKIVIKFYTGYFNEKMQHDMGKNTDGRISYAMDYGIPMKFVFKTTSICKGKSIKTPNRCRKYKTCKVVHGKKRSYCRKNKNTRKKSGGSNSDHDIPTTVTLDDVTRQNIPTATAVGIPEAIPMATNVQPDMVRDTTYRQQQREELAKKLHDKRIDQSRKSYKGSRKSYKGSRKNKQRGGLSKPSISQFDYKSFVAEHKDNLIKILLDSVDKNKITKKYVASKEEFNDITQKINNCLSNNQKGGATPPTTPRGRTQPTIDPPNTSFTQEDFQNIHDILQQQTQQLQQQHILDGPYGDFQDIANREPFHVLNMDPLFNVSCILFELLVLIEHNDRPYGAMIIPLFILSGFALHLQLNHRIGNWRENR
jgi:hypothetical protein